jgi:hypothetical protein
MKSFIHPRFKLGKNKPIFDPRTLLAKNYRLPAPPGVLLPKPPQSLTWADIIKMWYELGNDVAGDCTFAAFMHLVMLWTALAGRAFTPTAKQVLNAYYTFTGGVDSGADMLDVLKYARKTGICGHKIVAFLGINIMDVEEVQWAMSIFGGAYSGLDLPDRVVPEDPNANWLTIPWWDISQDPDPGNGHCVPLVNYIYIPPPKTISIYPQVVTWGAKKDMGLPFFQKYCANDGGNQYECYAIVTQDFLDKQGVSPTGLNLQALLADLNAVQQIEAPAKIVEARSQRRQVKQ